MSSITIKKAQIKNGTTLSVEYSEQVKNGVENIKKDCTPPIHDDLRRAFGRLNIHLGLLTEQVREDESSALVPVQYGFNDEPVEDTEMYNLDNINHAIAKELECTGFTIGGTGDSEGVCLIGNRRLRAARVINLVSPFQKWSNDVYEYDYVNGLAEHIDNCKAEVHAYLFEGKQAPDPQMELSFPGENEG